MVDYNLKRIENYCRSNGLNPPVLDVEQIGTEFVATIVVTGEGVEDLKKSELGHSESEARYEAIKEFVNDFVLIAPNGRQNSPPLTNSQVSSTSVHSSEIIDDEISHLPNCVGYLNEICQKKSYALPTYKVLNQSGEPHNPLFIMECTLDAKEFMITGEGKGCPKNEAKKRAAQNVIRKLREREAPLARNVSAGAVRPDISNYFKSKFQDSTQLAQNLVENGSDYCQKLNRLAALLDCRLDYVLSGDVPNYVVLKIIVNESDYPLITTFGASDEGADVSRRIAAKKAVLMIKVLNTNDDN